jgi:hypothetical protein
VQRQASVSPISQPILTVRTVSATVSPPNPVPAAVGPNDHRLSSVANPDGGYIYRIEDAASGRRLWQSADVSPAQLAAMEAGQIFSIYA